MKIMEYDPSLSPSEWEIGESYIFIRNESDIYNKDITISKQKQSKDVTLKDGVPGVTVKGGEPGVTVKKNKIDETTGEEVEGGVTIKVKAATISKNTINIDGKEANPSGLKYGRFIKQVGKIIDKIPLEGNAVYLCVEFETSNGVIGRKYRCPMDSSMYYTIDKMIENSGKEVILWWDYPHPF